MKYYLIVGEASGDLHAAHLMEELLRQDSSAEFRFFGGDKMKAVGGELVRHYRDMAFMGFIPVLLNLKTIFANMKFCKADILEWNPDVVILVDYPGFNLKIAKFLKEKTNIPTFYYISPKIWAWKEYRIKNIKRDIDELFSILPFEVDFYHKHNYKIHYVGSPTVDEIHSFKQSYKESKEELTSRLNLSEKPVIAVLAGSRKQEIKDNLPMMLDAAAKYPDYQVVLAGAPGIDEAYYNQFLLGREVKLVFGETYPVLTHAYAALVTSGTATLETALFNVPQAVCYYTPARKLIAYLRKKVLKVSYISLVNLIMDDLLIQELVADTMTPKHLDAELNRLLTDIDYRKKMMEGYEEMANLLGEPGAPMHAAEKMIEILKK